MAERYTWDEMTAVDSMFAAIKNVGHVALNPVTLADVLLACQLYIKPQDRPALRGAVAKLRREPWDVLAAWIDGKADWGRPGTEEVFELTGAKPSPIAREVGGRAVLPNAQRRTPTDLPAGGTEP